MKKARKSKRLYYPAGILSLVLLPVLCMWYFNSVKAFDKPRVLEMVWGNWYKVINKSGTPPERTYEQIRITENDAESKMKLDKAEQDIRNLVTSGNMKKGFHFIFDNNANYWTLVRVLDICKTEKPRFYLVDENQLWVCNYVEPPAPVLLTRQMDTQMMCCVIPGYNLEKDAELVAEEKAKQKAYVFQTIKKYSISVFLFVVLIALSIRQLYRLHIQYK